MKLPLATLGRAWYIASMLFGIGRYIYRDFELLMFVLNNSRLMLYWMIHIWNMFRVGCDDQETKYKMYEVHFWANSKVPFNLISTISEQ